jgi:hypothetical protein
VGINNGRHGIGGVVEAVHKLKCQGDHKRQTQQDVGPSGTKLDAIKVACDAGADENETGDEHQSEDQRASATRTLA